jgi:PUA domain protein
LHQIAPTLIVSFCFIRFDPKEDIASSTSLKSSAQRHIRTAICEQIPFLTRPAYVEASSTTENVAPVPEAEPDIEETAPEAVEEKSKGGKGSKKKGGAKSEKKGKGKHAMEEKEETSGSSEPLQVIDEIWPKKEAIAITKW